MIVAGLIPAQSSAILKVMGLIFVATLIELAGLSLVIVGVDGALKENEYVHVWVFPFSLGLSVACTVTVTSFSIS